VWRHATVRAPLGSREGARRLGRRREPAEEQAHGGGSNGGQWMRARMWEEIGGVL
jgi:hypothetical protein